jgi:Protein of unknown function (DUF4232)
MTARRAPLLGAGLMFLVVAATSGCTPQQRDTDPNGRCLGWQLAVTAEVHPTSTSVTPSWDLEFKDTSKTACVFGGVPDVRTFGASTKISAGVITSAESEEWAVQLAPNDVAYANVALAHPVPTGCSPITVRKLAVVAPHVAGGKYVVKAPAAFSGCAGSTVVGRVGQVTAKRSK